MAGVGGDSFPDVFQAAGGGDVFLRPAFPGSQAHAISQTVSPLPAGPVTLRHIQKGTATGAITILGASFLPRDRAGLKTFKRGSFERLLDDDGAGTLLLPNQLGDDGVLHRRRFAILTDADYRPGDEWVEIEHGQVVFVGTPTDYELSRSTLSITLVDALWLQNLQRETAAGFWTHAPRDVFEHYTKAWRPLISEDFEAGVDPAKWDLGVGATAANGNVILPENTSIKAKTGAFEEVNLATDRAWRFEASFTLDRAPDNLNIVTIEIDDPRGDFLYPVELIIGSTYVVTRSNDLSLTVRSGVPVNRPVSAAIEVRDRFIYFYVDATLLNAFELSGIDGLFTAQPWLSSTAGQTTLHSVLMKRCDPFLMRGSDKGDYRVPGQLPAGGLQGTYYDEADLRAYNDNSAQVYALILAPTRSPYARRQDSTINFPSMSPATWQPPGPLNGEWFSVRWVGAIYLDLAAADVTLRLTQLDNSARLWVGKTLYDQQLLAKWPGGPPNPDTVASGSLRTHLGTQQSGWYPIRIDYAQGAGFAGIVLQRSIAGGAYEVVPSTALSPYGCYEAQVRYDSHAEQLKAIGLAYGLHYRCDPRSLESGEFPGTVVPRLRVGRDTDKILTPDESTEGSVKGSAGETIDTLYADAAGLGDQANTVQLTTESVNFAAIAPGKHMTISSAYESLADITDPILLQTRLASMLGLRLTPWQEVSARPSGHKQLRDTFPLTGTLAMLLWEPGDGLRVIDEDLDIIDEFPRQMISIQWEFVPDALGFPQVRFRQRPRSQQEALRALIRAALLPQRNYQGQRAIVTGTRGDKLADAYSRVSLPTDIKDVVRAELVVQVKADTSLQTIELNGTSTGPAVTATGRYDVTPYIARAAGGAEPRAFARLTGGTGGAEYALELLVRV